MGTEKVDVMVIAPLPPTLLSELEQAFTIHNWWLSDDKEALLKRVASQIRGVVTRSHLGIDAAMLKALPALEIVSIFGVGLDATDVVAAHEQGVIVTHTPGVLSGCVADTALGHMLNVSRRYHVADRYLREGQWLREHFPSSSRVHGKVCGIAGLGLVGQEVAKRAQAFNMEIHYYDPFTKHDTYKQFDTLTALAESVDFLVLTLPGGKHTHHIVNSEVLSALGPDGILVNVARGTVVDTQALISALTNNTILGAGLDVFEDEPNVPLELLEFDNVFLTPHLASNTRETRADMANLAAANIKSYFENGQVFTPVKRK